jgi:uncharacterized surface protein with fasciclin (FAS1) repeats
MKTSILALALVAALCATACAKQESASDPNAMPTADNAMPGDDTSSAPANDAMDNDVATAPESTTSENPMVGGAPMLASKDIIDNAVNSQDHTTLVAAVKAAGLVDTLKGPGPFTVFAPTNTAFDALPKGTVDTLLKPENKADLAKVLTYHVVSGNLDSKALAAQIEAGGGKAMLKTVQGENLTANMDGDKLVLTDAKGGKSTVTIADVRQSNGVIHVVDHVLMP